MVLTQVSSMKTRKTRPGRINPRLIFFPTRAAARHSGRSCSAGRTLFFEAHSLAMDEIPDRAIADGNAAFGEFRHEPRTVTSGSAAIRSMSQPRSPMRVQARWPPIFPPAALSVFGVPKPLRPAHHTRHAHREDRGNGAHAVLPRPVRQLSREDPMNRVWSSLPAI